MGSNVKRYPSPNSVTVGSKAEQNARTFLETQGLTYIDSNYRCNVGEIDLIMQDEVYLVFVEVRLRKNPNYGNSIETISRSKQQRVIRTAKHYLQATKQHDKVDCRFDAIGIDANNNLTWIKNAFEN